MRTIKAVIFDLDGVIVSTDEYHFQAWKRLADSLGIPFGRESNDRIRGVSRMESLEIVLEKSVKRYSLEEKREMAERKNAYYGELLKTVSPSEILPGAVDMINALKERGVKIAIGSSSRNARAILRAVGLEDEFDVIADGSHVTRSKPDPEVFRLAAQRMGVPSEQCLVVEDADAGVEAALAAGMSVLAVGSANGHPKATLSAENLAQITPDKLPLATGIAAVVTPKLE
jgi:beta-phosphoglucomutase